MFESWAFWRFHFEREAIYLRRLASVFAGQKPGCQLWVIPCHPSGSIIRPVWRVEYFHTHVTISQEISALQTGSHISFV